jgi:hypothetical protein
VTCTISDGVPAGCLGGVRKAQFLPDACPPGHSNGVAFWQGAFMRCSKGAEEGTTGCQRPKEPNTLKRPKGATCRCSTPIHRNVQG